MSIGSRFNRWYGLFGNPTNCQYIFRVLLWFRWPLWLIASACKKCTLNQAHNLIRMPFREFSALYYHIWAILEQYLTCSSAAWDQTREKILWIVSVQSNENIYFEWNQHFPMCLDATKNMLTHYENHFCWYLFHIKTILRHSSFFSWNFHTCDQNKREGISYNCHYL